MFPLKERGGGNRDIWAAEKKKGEKGGGGGVTPSNWERVGDSGVRAQRRLIHTVPERKEIVKKLQGESATCCKRKIGASPVVGRGGRAGGRVFSHWKKKEIEAAFPSWGS